MARQLLRHIEWVVTKNNNWEVKAEFFDGLKWESKEKYIPYLGTVANSVEIICKDKTVQKLLWKENDFKALSFWTNVKIWIYLETEDHETKK